MLAYGPDIVALSASIVCGSNMGGSVPVVPPIDVVPGLVVVPNPEVEVPASPENELSAPPEVEVPMPADTPSSSSRASFEPSSSSPSSAIPPVSSSLSSMPFSVGRNTAAELSQADVLAPIPTNRRRPRKDRLDRRTDESQITYAMPHE